MQKTPRNFWLLFINTFTISAFTFGGGYVIVPLMKRRFVDKLGWLEEKQMLDSIAIAQSAPGVLAVNTSVMVGQQLLGFGGVLVAVLATVLPPLVILSVISLFYAAFRDNVAVAAVLKGMQVGVAAVIADVVIGLAATVIKRKLPLPIIIMVLAFIAGYVLGVNVVVIILFCAVLGVLCACAGRKKGREYL